MRIYGGQHLTFQVVRERKGETEMVKIMSAVGEGDVKFTLVRFWQRGVRTIPSFRFSDVLWARSVNEREK